MKNESKTNMVAFLYPVRDQLNKLVKQVGKLITKRKDTAATSKVKPSFLKHIQIKLMVVNQYTKTIAYYFKEGVVKGTLLLFIKGGTYHPAFSVFKQCQLKKNKNNCQLLLND